MGHHYLPQFYLRGFADENRVWVHDRQERRSFLAPPKVIANENKLYTDELEQHLANEVEDPAKPAIAAVRSGKDHLDSGQREALARYVITLWKRVPEARTRVYAGVPEVAESLRHEVHSRLDAAAANDPELAQRAESRKAQYSEAIEKFKKEPPPEVWHQNLMRDSSPNVVQALLSMTWRVLLSLGPNSRLRTTRSFSLRLKASETLLRS